MRAIAALRARGEAVVVALPGEGDASDRRLVLVRGAWRVEEK
jgi:hypothetical protein